MTTRVEMLNRALLRIGADPIGSETEAGAAVHLAVYDSVFDYLLGVHPWSFLRVTRRLVQMATPPAQHFAYAYQLPPERLGPIRAVYAMAERRQPVTDYHLAGDLLLTDHPAIWATFMEAKAPAYWPGEFREGFTVLLMSELALSVREERTLRDALRQDALGTPREQPHGGLIGTAISQDSMAEPSTIVGGGLSPLIDARGANSARDGCVVLR